MTRTPDPECVTKAWLFVGILVLCTSSCEGYSRSNGSWNHVVINAAVLREETPISFDPTFRVLACGEYAKDRNTVFHKRDVIAGADASTFEVVRTRSWIPFSMGRDWRSVYIFDRRVPNADPKTFESVIGPYCKDANRWYCGTVAADIAHPENLEVVYWMGEWDYSNGDSWYTGIPSEVRVRDLPLCAIPIVWARDGEFYYFGPYRVHDCDYDSFRVFFGSNASDKYGEFSGPLSRDYREYLRGKY